MSDADAALARFTDVSADPASPRYSEHHEAIAWMSEAEVSTGWSDGTFRPRSQVTRDAIAAFLMRTYGA